MLDYGISSNDEAFADYFASANSSAEDEQAEPVTSDGWCCDACRARGTMQGCACGTLEISHPMGSCGTGACGMPVAPVAPVAPSAGVGSEFSAARPVDGPWVGIYNFDPNSHFVSGALDSSPAETAVQYADTTPAVYTLDRSYDMAHLSRVHEHSPVVEISGAIGTSGVITARSTEAQRTAAARFLAYLRATPVAERNTLQIGQFQAAIGEVTANGQVDADTRERLYQITGERVDAPAGGAGGAGGSNTSVTGRDAARWVDEGLSVLRDRFRAGDEQAIREALERAAAAQFADNRNEREYQLKLAEIRARAESGTLRTMTSRLESNSQQGLGTGAMIGIGVGIAALAYFFSRKGR